MTARLLLLAAALLFSTGGAAIKGTELSGWQVASFRSAIAAVALLALVRDLRRLADRKVLVVSCAYAATMLCFVLANKLTTAANAIFLQATAPLYVLLLGPWLLKERLRPGDWPVLATVAVGMGLFVVDRPTATALAPNPLAGDLIGLASGLCWALTMIGLRALSRDGASAGLPAVLGGNILCALAALPFALNTLDGPIATADLIALGWLGLIQIGLAYVCLTYGLRGVPAFEASLLLLLEPLLNPLWAWALHGERPGRLALAGGLLILAASVWRSARTQRVAAVRVA